MKRIFLFIATNVLVVLTISLLVRVLGLEPYLTARGMNYTGLLTFCALFGFVGSFISLQLSRWSAKRAMGVELIDPANPGGREAAKLVETVQSLCQREGLPLPEIGVYDSPEVNAFATGPSRSRALVAVSTGLLGKMDSRAVEGVLGHELAHVANGDMVTMALVQGVVNTFVMFFARVATFAVDQALRGRDDRGGGGLGRFAHYALVSLFELVFGLLATPVVCWFSRHREFRADAGSARLLGPDTMIHALRSLESSARVVDKTAPALAAFKIHGETGGILETLFRTHPPIEARIAALQRGA